MNIKDKIKAAIYWEIKALNFNKIRFEGKFDIKFDGH